MGKVKLAKMGLSVLELVSNFKPYTFLSRFQIEWQNKLLIYYKTLKFI